MSAVAFGRRIYADRTPWDLSVLLGVMEKYNFAEFTTCESFLAEARAEFLRQCRLFSVALKFPDRYFPDLLPATVERLRNAYAAVGRTPFAGCSLTFWSQVAEDAEALQAELDQARREVLA